MDSVPHITGGVNLGKHLIISTMAVALFSCVTQQQEAADEPISPTSIGFEVSESPLESHADPLPDKQDIYTTWHYSDATSKRVLSYRGWDFNKDGRIDMLEVLALDGTPEAMAFDFDGDGKIDMLKKRKKNEFDISQAVNMPAAPAAEILAH
jgi:hypothetical protein